MEKEPKKIVELKSDLDDLDCDDEDEDEFVMFDFQQMWEEALARQLEAKLLWQGPFTSGNRTFKITDVT